MLLLIFLNTIFKCCEQNLGKVNLNNLPTSGKIKKYVFVIWLNWPFLGT